MGRLNYWKYAIRHKHLSFDLIATSIRIRDALYPISNGLCQMLSGIHVSGGDRMGETSVAPGLSLTASPGPLFTKKTPSYGYRDPHDEAKTVWRLYQVYNGNPYTDKTASF